MKNPAASGGVSKEHELPILMKLLIFFPLPLDVIPYRRLIAMLTYGARKISIAPKFSTPQLLLDLGTHPKNFLGRDTLYHCYQLRNAIQRHRLHQKVNVILIHSYLQKLHLISLLDLQTHVANYLVDLLIKYCSPVLRWKHHVLQQHRDIMALMNVLALASTLRPKGRGINPVVIQIGPMGSDENQ